MERALKERIIGAVVLVVFVVLVVPVFLDGPPNEDEVVSERVLLPGQEDHDTNTVILNRQRSEPIPVVSRPQEEPRPQPTSVAEAREEQAPARPVVEEKKPVPEEAPQEPSRERIEPPAAASSTTGMWAVQLGSFSNKQNAEKLAADLRKQGYAAFLSQLQTGSRQLHRVRIGPQKDRQSAEAMAARLLKVGHKGQVVPHP